MSRTKLEDACRKAVEMLEELNPFDYDSPLSVLYWMRLASFTDERARRAEIHHEVEKHVRHLHHPEEHP